MDDYQDYCGASTTAQTRFLTVEEGVALKVIDFIPADENPEQPVVIFVAGWISMMTGWRDFLQVLTGQYRTIYIESREKGSSKVDDTEQAEFSIARFTADLAALVPQVVPQGRDFVLTGSSLGSTTVLEYLLSDAPRPRAAWIIAPNAEFGFPRFLFYIVKHLPVFIWYAGFRPIVKFYIKHFRVDRKNEPEQWAKYSQTLDEIDPRKLQRNVIALDDYSLWGRMGAINDPVVIVGGESDKLHGAEFMQRIVDEIPNGQLQMMASNKATHSDKAAALLVDYLNSLKGEQT